MARSRQRKKAVKRRSARVEITGLGRRGHGVGLVDGKPVYIPYTVPGDVVEATVADAHGSVTAVLEGGNDRREAPCAHFGDCGGCALQHITPSLYQRWKRGLVVAALQREGFDASIVEPLQTCPQSSRRRADFAARRLRDRLVFGFHQLRSGRIEPVNDCLILAAPLRKRLASLSAFAEKIPFDRFDIAVTACDNGLDINLHTDADADLLLPHVGGLPDIMAQTGAVRLSVNGDPALTLAEPFVTVGQSRLFPTPGGFLQASREGQAALLAAINEWTCDLKPKRIADLFCGVGAFSLPMAARAAVFAWDSDEAAILALDLASRVGKERFPVTTERRNLFERPVAAAELKSMDIVIFDPPRAGAFAQSKEIANSAVPLVIGVSCNPETFARDAATLRAGGYALETVRPVDQFIYAAHVELVGFFRRR
ncbi:MAG: TRAM domain-containing protein [Pseudomonadota bacterium]